MTGKKNKLKSGEDDPSTSMILKEIASIHKKLIFLEKQKAGFPPEMQALISRETRLIVGKYRASMMKICDGAQRFMHNLNDRVHDDMMIHQVVKTFPQVLVTEDSEGVIPIQVAALHDKSVSFVPTLGDLGNSLGFGGLFLKDPGTKLSPLQTIAVANNHRALSNGTEEKYLTVLQKIDKQNHLHQHELVNPNVLRHISDDQCEERFRYLFNRFPVALKKKISQSKDLPIHRAASSEKNFKLCLEFGMKYYRTRFGFLFKTNSLGQTPLELAVEHLGINVASKLIEECIPPKAHYPILHKIVKHTPQFFHDFVLRYTYCLSKKDSSGRLPLHYAIGHSQKGVSLELLLMAHERALIERDPKTNLYPFMIPEIDCVTTIYTLLRRNPGACPVLKKNKAKPESLG